MWLDIEREGGAFRKDAGKRDCSDRTGCLFRLRFSQAFATASHFLSTYGAVRKRARPLVCLLAASVWADPEVGKSTIQTFNATEVGKELGAAFCNSIPLIIDELQLIKDNRKDFDRMIYPVV